MIKCLYEKFNNWDRYSNIYLYSDPHFTDPEGIYNDADEVNMRKFFSYADNETQISNINSKVHKDDLLIILGDIGCPKELLKLKCKNLILITGNHDAGLTNYKPYFLEMYDGPLFISNKILLSHEPIHNIPGIFNIHGHIHNQSQIDEYRRNGETNFLCVSANLQNYQPISLTDLIKRKGIFLDFAGLSNCKGIHRIFIDKAIERKREKSLSNFTTM